MSIKSVHIGAELFEVAKRHKLTITEIAKRAGYGQSMFYKHVKQEDLSFSILKKYADSMNYDFKAEIPDFTKYLKDLGLLEQHAEEFSKQDLLDKIEYWKDQAFEATRKTNELLQQSIEKQKENDDLRRELEELKRERNRN